MGAPGGRPGAGGPLPGGGRTPGAPNQMRIRTGRPEDAEILTPIAREAKASWGYPVLPSPA